ncbi:MAG TPA: hypothetical protein VK770_08940 [Candidatus Acidoferrum sp.]|jgi:hypothetical protein|nr:hypothetical protein [Candidatus Acidoferrum sp.]
MAVEGIRNLAQILAFQLRQQALASRVGANEPGPGNAGNAAASEDTFTPSTQNNSVQATAQDAGIFQVSQGALSAVTANALFAQTSSNAALSGGPALPASATTPNAGNAQTAATKNSDPPGSPQQPHAATLPGQAPPAKAAPATNVQEQIQFLNSALPALGLSKVEIQEIDRIAAQFQNFNPAAYTDLINQFEALAHQATQQGAANAAANNPANPNTPANIKVIGGAAQG